MSAAEFGRWLEFFHRHGRCGPTRMFDAGPALLAWKVDHAIGGQSQITDYLPFNTDPEHVATVDDIIKALGVQPRG